MRIRAIDENRDWTFGKGRESYAVDEKCVTQNARTKLLEFTNDCFFNMEAGVDWITLMRQKNRQNQIALSCRAILLKAQGINRVNSVDIVLERIHTLFIFFKIQTIFSKGAISQTEVVNI